LATFWLKIEQFWPFEEISIFSNVAIILTAATWQGVA
jgi:hypothetical protein